MSMVTMVILTYNGDGCYAVNYGHNYDEYGCDSKDKYNMMRS
jgi:hypothetical protein